LVYVVCLSVNQVLGKWLTLGVVFHGMCCFNWMNLNRNDVVTSYCKYFNVAKWF
jgi:hypothetical protein